MTVIAGMDLGYGSQVKIVRTNYLTVLTNAAATVQQMSNYLEMYNNLMTSRGRGFSNLTCDYIGSHAHAPSDAAVGTGANVLPLITTNSVNVPFGGNHANPDAKKQGTQLKPLAVLSVTGIEFTNNTLTAAAYVPVVLADNITAQVNANLLIDNLGAVADDTDITGLTPFSLNLDGMFDDVAAAAATGTVLVSSIAASAFVSAGNTDGTTPTSLADYGTLGAAAVGIVSVVTLASTSL
ncbi:hypothetical protein OAA39_00855 [bacterium]|nr:hypothetical protein [bacterium]